MYQHIYLQSVHYLIPNNINHSLICLNYFHFVHVHTSLHNVITNELHINEFLYLNLCIVCMLCYEHHISWIIHESSYSLSSYSLVLCAKQDDNALPIAQAAHHPTLDWCCLQKSLIRKHLSWHWKYCKQNGHLSIIIP